MEAVRFVWRTTWHSTLTKWVHKRDAVITFCSGFWRGHSNTFGNSEKGRQTQSAEQVCQPPALLMRPSPSCVSFVFQFSTQSMVAGPQRSIVPPRRGLRECRWQNETLDDDRFPLRFRPCCGTPLLHCHRSLSQTVADWLKQRSWVSEGKTLF